jgi:hypothetical protein
MSIVQRSRFKVQDKRKHETGLTLPTSNASNAASRNGQEAGHTETQSTQRKVDTQFQFTHSTLNHE